MHSTTITPGATLGVLGGGQLGRMFVQAAQRLGFETLVFDPAPDSPAGRIAHDHIQAEFDDTAALTLLAQRCAGVTTEFENVPAQALALLAQTCWVAPGAQALAPAQDRREEKALFARCDIRCAPHAVINSSADLAKVPTHLLPGIVKTARLGYDGKGQISVADPSELAAAWVTLGQVPCVLEQRLALAQEWSMVVARGYDGSVVSLPAQRNWHRAGVLALTEVMADQALPPALLAQARAASETLATRLAYVGVLCVEFFLTDSGTLLVNEIAPRPHNSGHWSMDACSVSQFELQVRTLARWPLTQPQASGPAAMLNLMGELWFKNGALESPPWQSVLALPGTHLHLYGKTEARPGRKMGHLNVTGATPAAVRATVAQAASLLGIAAFYD